MLKRSPAEFQSDELSQVFSSPAMFCLMPHHNVCPEVLVICTRHVLGWCGMLEGCKKNVLGWCCNITARAPGQM